MKINQDTEFKPITITIETKDEAQLFWDMIELSYNSLEGRKREMAIEISNWFFDTFEKEFD